MSVWEWVHDYRDEAEIAEDEERLRLCDLYREALDIKETDPGQALTILREGRRLAEQLDEPRWALFYDHWTLQVRLFDADDYRNILDLAVKTSLEAAKPQFADLPQRVCLHEDLIFAHVNIDPFGYAGEIEKALAYMAGQVSPEVECRHCLQGCRTTFELARNDNAAARASALKQLDMADEQGQDHYGASALGNLCQLSYRQRDYGALGSYASEGEDLARSTQRSKLIAEFQMWQAAAARALQDEKTAQRQYRHAKVRVERLDRPSDEFYDAQSHFHELGGDLEKALKVRNRQLARLQDRGRFACECRVHLERCKLLKKMQQLEEEDVSAARAAAQQTRDPGPYLEELKQATM